MSKKYQVLPPTAPVPAPDDMLENLAREGAQRMLARALEIEVEEFLGRGRYERGEQFRGYRNGYHQARTVGVGMGAVELRVPRVSDVPEEVAPQGFQSEIVERYQRNSRTQGRLLCRLYLEGLSTGDFEPVFRALVGETVGLSPNTIVRLKAEWEQEYLAWKQRPLSGRWVYLFGDGIYLRGGLEKEKTAVLVVIGVDEHGHKDLLAMEEGYRESTESWLGVLRSMRDRGLSEAPLLMIGDGALGLWAALDELWPNTRRQRCWNHRRINLIDKLPKRLQAKAQKRLREIYDAPTRQECTAHRDAYCAELRVQGQEPAAACLERDWEDFVTFYDFPQEHWTHLRTTNPIESVFSGVRLRTNVTKRQRVRENALYLVFKLVLRLGVSWHAITAPNQIKLLLSGHRFKNGQLELEAQATSPVAAGAGA